MAAGAGASAGAGEEDLSAGFGGLSISKKIITAASQASGSHFCKKLPLGFGYLPLSCQFDPTYQWDNSLSSRFIPDRTEIEIARPIFICGEGPGLQCIAEGASFGTMHALAQAYDAKDMAIGRIKFVSNERSTFTKHKLSLGIASSGTYHDIDIRLPDNILVAICEGKGSDLSILQPAAQAATESTNLCLGLYNRGVPREHCIIPVIAYNGLSICFGATILLNDTFPTFVPTSRILSLLDEAESQVASAYIHKILKHAHLVSTLPRMPPEHQATQMELNCSDYFLKHITQAVFDRGFGLFTDSLTKTEIQNGVSHMIRCLNRIYNSPARCVAEYPISIRTPDILDDWADTSGTSDYILVFTDLTKRGFSVGVPNRVANPGLYAAFLVELVRAVTAVHDAGVIHVDLYASNIMWKEERDGSVCVKIIDWDTAHSLLEGAFATRVAEKLKEGPCRTVPEAFGVDYDMHYLKIYQQDVEDNAELWVRLSSGNKQIIDSAFFELIIMSYPKY